jgi:hypothetical protein
VNDIPLLSITFADGSEDVAVLIRYNPIPIEKDEFRSEVDQCIFKGFLRNDPSSEVTMAGGCPGEDSFDVRFDF